jgi:tagatose-1,6-bisphosphate aldolase
VVGLPLDLDRLCDPGGRFAILAMDQRGTLRGLLDQAGLRSADEDLSAFKVDVIGALSPHVSGVLTDIEYGVGAVKAAGVLDPRAGLIIASERSPQPTWRNAHHSEYRNEYRPAERGPAFVAANGGVALKYLVRWRPDFTPGEGEPDLVTEAYEAVRHVVEDCRAYGMPSIVEPLVTRATPATVVRSAEVLAELRPDLLKLEWPGDAAGCAALTRVCGPVPWTLLSGGTGYEGFVERVLTALDHGASGYIAGRAFWGEAAGLTGPARTTFLRDVAVSRINGLNAAIAGHGRPWREVAGV